MPTLLRPPRLKAGGTIGVAAISGAVDPSRLDAGIARLRGRGYSVVEAANLRRTDGMFAGSDADRAEGYRALLRDPRVDAIFFARGGYGASRVLGRLDEAEVAANPKIHLGGSDLTALFAFFRASGLVAFYGPMVAVEIAEQDGLDWEGVLSGERPSDHAFAERRRHRPRVGRGVAPGRLPVPDRVSLRHARSDRRRRGACFSGRTSARRSTAWTEC